MVEGGYTRIENKIGTLNNLIRSKTTTGRRGGEVDQHQVVESDSIYVDAASSSLLKILFRTPSGWWQSYSKAVEE
jgi:hypothetical protein